MKSDRLLGVALVGFGCVVWSGCAPKMTIEKLREMRPERPSELDQLDAFVGHWEWEGTVKIAGLDQPLHFAGKSETEWAGDGWYLVSRESATMEEIGESQNTGIWSYDAKAGEFRFSGADSMGTTMRGTGRRDGTTGAWHFKGESHGGPLGATTAKGSVRFPSADTMEWDWHEYTAGGLMKMMERSGTGKRAK